MINIKDPQEFFMLIEELSNQLDCSVIDALIHYCETNNLEIESVAALVKSNAKIKSKVKMEAEDLNFLPKSSRLPL